MTDDGVPVVLGARRDARSGPVCRAPTTSLYLDQHGDVRACCQSTYVLGNVGERSVQEIWTGERAEALRAAVAEGDLSLGCGYCAWAGRAGDADAAFARRFDDLPEPEPGAGPVQLELALSNTCNLQCVQCVGELSSAIRAHREHLPPLPKAYGEAFFAQLEQLLPDVRHVELFGGEPLLSVESRRVLRLLRTAAPDVQVRVTTNATVWNDELQRLAEELHLSFVVSIDGASPGTYEAIRVGASWRTVRDRLDHLRDLTERTGADLALAHCLMVENWWELPSMFRLAAQLDAALWINTVLSPVASSLYHLPVEDLRAIVEQLEGADPEVQALGEPWCTTWTNELDRLRLQLDDRQRGLVHAHLGPGDAGAGGGLRADDATFAGGRVIELGVDDELVVQTAALVQDDPALPPYEPLAPTGGRPAPELDEGALRSGVGASVWTVRSADHERLERRSFVRSLAGLHRLTLEQRAVATLDELADELRTAAGSGAVVGIVELTDEYRIARPLPDPHLQRALGLSLQPGAPCLHPVDVLERHHQAEPPVLERWDLDPVTERVQVRCASGLELTCAMRSTVQAGAVASVHILIAAPAGAA